MNKRISVSFTISLVVNFLLVILVCVAGLRIENLKAELVNSGHEVAYQEAQVDYWQTSSDEYKVLYEEQRRDYYDAEQSFVNYMVGFFSGLSGRVLTEEELTAEFIKELLAGLNSPPDIIETTRIVEVEKMVEVEKEVIVYRDRTDFRFFETLPEFTAWLEGKLHYKFSPADCDDYAQSLQIAAYRKGYIISAQLVDNGNINGKIVSDNKEFHDGIRVNIGNEIYYVEPNPDGFRIIKICNRD